MQPKGIPLARPFLTSTLARNWAPYMRNVGSGKRRGLGAPQDEADKAAVFRNIYIESKYWS